MKIDVRSLKVRPLDKHARIQLEDDSREGTLIKNDRNDSEIIGFNGRRMFEQG